LLGLLLRLRRLFRKAGEHMGGGGGGIAATRLAQALQVAPPYAAGDDGGGDQPVVLLRSGELAHPAAERDGVGGEGGGGAQRQAAALVEQVVLILRGRVEVRAQRVVQGPDKFCELGALGFAGKAVLDRRPLVRVGYGLLQHLRDFGAHHVQVAQRGLGGALDAFPVGLIGGADAARVIRRGGFVGLGGRGGKQRGATRRD